MDTLLNEYNNYIIVWPLIKIMYLKTCSLWDTSVGKTSLISDTSLRLIDLMGF